MQLESNEDDRCGGFKYVINSHIMLVLKEVLFIVVAFSWELFADCWAFGKPGRENR